MTPSTLEQVQEGWRKRWADPVIERPSCYGREPFGGVWREGCSAWFKPSGNAYVTDRLSKDSKSFPWAICNGCKRKAEA